MVGRHRPATKVNKDRKFISARSKGCCSCQTSARDSRQPSPWGRARFVNSSSSASKAKIGLAFGERPHRCFSGFCVTLRRSARDKPRSFLRSSFIRAGLCVMWQKSQEAPCAQYPLANRTQGRKQRTGCSMLPILAQPFRPLCMSKCSVESAWL